MTLNEAIENAESCEFHRCAWSVDDNVQLAEWLKELKSLRDAVSRLTESRNNMLKEHMWLEDMLRESRQANEHLHRENRRCRDIINARHPNAASAVGELLRENAKLRDLVREMLICESYLVSDAFDWYGCEGCPLHAGECNFKVRAKDFGIEVK